MDYINKLLDEFNTVFEGNASAVIIDGRLEITIGSKTLIISLPEIIGGQATGSSQLS